MKLTIKRMMIAAATIGTLTATPALAGGSFSFTLNPQSAEQHQLMRAGLFAAAMANDMSKQGGIKQNGFGNAAGILQNGFGNQGIVIQDGNGHNGTIRQNGNDNAYGLFQFGRNTNGHVVQNGHGRTGTTFQFGW
ncbi:curlin [Roseibium sp. SCP14]|uniref:curlin n=1 Tax=Roseibium sp. SCP14 TaxID=3141375 RepID=UPI003335DBB8